VVVGGSALLQERTVPPPPRIAPVPAPALPGTPSPTPIATPPTKPTVLTATHILTDAIGRGGELKFGRLSTFALNTDGNLLCVDSGAIKVVSPDGKLVDTWKSAVSAETICSADDGVLYVAGGGKIARLDSAGAIEKVADLPRAGNRRGRVASVTASGQNVFVSGYGNRGLTVHRFDRDLGKPTEIITGLRGCCGQMDIKARGEELFVAENGRFRVCRYDRDGKLLASWGRRDRNAPDGFGGCCNPMNVCFATNGDVLTSESTHPGWVKRFSADGEFLGIIGAVSSASGCAHVAAAMSSDGEKVYVVDTSKKIIHVLSRKKAPADGKASN